MEYGTATATAHHTHNHTQTNCCKWSYVVRAAVGRSLSGWVVVFVYLWNSKSHFFRGPTECDLTVNLLQKFHSFDWHFRSCSRTRLSLSSSSSMVINKIFQVATAERLIAGTFGDESHFDIEWNVNWNVKFEKYTWCRCNSNLFGRECHFALWMLLVRQRANAEWNSLGDGCIAIAMHCTIAAWAFNRNVQMHTK